MEKLTCSLPLSPSLRSRAEFTPTDRSCAPFAPSVFRSLSAVGLPAVFISRVYSDAFSEHRQAKTQRNTASALPI
jgi:hypothetical protein